MPTWKEGIRCEKKFLALACTIALINFFMAGCVAGGDRKSVPSTQDTLSETSGKESYGAISDTVAPSGNRGARVHQSEKHSAPLEGKHLVFGLSADFPPFEYVEGEDESGNTTFAGFDIDLVEAFSKRLGFTYEFSDMPFDQLFTSISDGGCDVIVSGTSITEERDKVVDASDPYYMPRISILSYADDGFSDVKALEGHSCGVCSGTVCAQICADNGNIEVVEFDSEAYAFAGLQNGTVDACMFDAVEAIQFVNDNPDLNLVNSILSSSYSEDYGLEGYAVLVPEGDTELLRYFDEAIADMKADGTLDALIKKWIGN